MRTSMPAIIVSSIIFPLNAIAAIKYFTSIPNLLELYDVLFNATGENDAVRENLRTVLIVLGFSFLVIGLITLILMYVSCYNQRKFIILGIFAIMFVSAPGGVLYLVWMPERRTTKIVDELEPHTR